MRGIFAELFFWLVIFPPVVGTVVYSLWLFLYIFCGIGELIQGLIQRHKKPVQ